MIVGGHILAGAGSPRVVASLTTWFSAPFTSGFEVLSRASCFLTASACGSQHFLFASAHVTHPHRFPHYFPDASFLSVLDDTSLRYSVELRDVASGGITSCAHLPPASRPARHPTRDVACLALIGGGGVLIRETLRGLVAMELAAGEPPLRAALRAEGHFLLPMTETERDEDTSLLLPRSVRGKLFHRSPAQTFLETEQVLERGMCGGPVLNDIGSVVGLVEGIVPLAVGGGGGDNLQARARELLGGAAVMVELDALREVLERAEREKGEEI